MAIEDVLYKNNVDIAFWGDFHQYERTYPMFRDQRVSGQGEEKTVLRKRRKRRGIDTEIFHEPLAPIHVVNAVGGNQEGTDILMLEGGPNTDPGFKLASWSAFR